MALRILKFEFQCSFPLCGNLTGQLAAASDSSETDAELSFAKSLKGSASIEADPGPEVGEEFLVGPKPLDLNVTYNLGSGHLCQMLRPVGVKHHWT